MKLSIKNRVKKELNIYSLFSGIGCYEYALRKSNPNINIVNFAEIDKQIAKMYCILNNVTLFRNKGDVVSIKECPEEDIDWLFASFPCKEFSKANNEPSHDTKLLEETIRIAKMIKPKNILIENVVEVRKTEIKNDLEALGYSVTEVILDAQYFGLPQRRVRVFYYCGDKLIKPQTPFTTVNLKDFMEPDFKELIVKGEEGWIIKQLCPPIVASYGRGVDSRGLRPLVVTTSGEHRKLTPLEGFALQGFNRNVAQKLTSKFSDSTIFKGIGNGIAIPVLQEIFRCVEE